MKMRESQNYPTLLMVAIILISMNGTGSGQSIEEKNPAKTEAPENGGVVLTAGGSVQSITADEFQALPRIAT